MRVLVFILMFLLSSVLVHAQFITGSVSNIFGEPLAGATITWSGTGLGTTTDELGQFRLEDKLEGDRILVFSYVGFKSDSLAAGETSHWNMQLIEDNTLAEVDVTAKGKATRYMDGVVKTEVIGKRELERAACCSLAGCFNTNAGVDAKTTNVVTDAKELRILGLSGVYNQILIDGMPLVQGAAYTFGASSIPGTMIEEIYVSKGANSVVQGFEGLTGQINIIPNSPEKADRIFINAFVNSFGESQYNANYMHRKTKWSNFTAVHKTLPAGEVDGDGDGFQDVAKTKRFSIFNKWAYDNPDNQKVRAQIGARFWNENRIGGQLTYTPNPENGLAPSPLAYGQNININQFDLYTKLNIKLAEKTSLIWLSSGFVHNQESLYGQKTYVVNQKNLYSNLALDHNFGTNQHNWKTGVSIRQNQMEEIIEFDENPLELGYGGRYTNNYTIPGIFTEGTFYLDRFTILAGIRTDYHGDFGWKITPRMLIRAEVNDKTDIRFSIGKGFRRVHLFSERVNLLASNRDLLIADVLEPEEALNIGLNLIQKVAVGGVNTTFIIDGYLTHFQNQVFPDFDRAVSQVYIENFTDRSISHSIQIENKWEVNDQIDFKWAYNYQYAAREISNSLFQLPLIPKHKVLAQTSLNTKDEQWQLDLTYKWRGVQRLPRSTDFPEQYQQPVTSPAYSMFDLQLTKRWTKFEIYGGVENIFNFRQNFPILGSDDPFGPFFDSSFNWGPTRGREFYIGVRYKGE